jgi:multidrug efflux pump subunit AcrA (membrane-fusion protein)
MGVDIVEDFKLKHGMFADVTIILSGAQKVLTVPAEAVLDDNNENIVFVKTGGQYTPRGPNARWEPGVV